MTFEETLTVLLGWIGSRLEVAIATAGDAPILIGSMVGTLRDGQELDAPGEEPAVFFTFKDGGTGFILARQHFSGAGWHQDNPAELAIRLGAVSLWVQQVNS